MALNWCCFCVSLRAGALTIGILYLVVNISVWLGWAGWFIAELAGYMSTSPENDVYERWFGTVRFLGFVLGALSLLCGINITMDSLLVHGIRRNRRKFMLPWVVWYGIFKTLTTLALLGTVVWLIVEYREAAKNPYDGIGILAAFLIMIGSISIISLPVLWYWYACVVSYYKLLAPSDVYAMEALREQDTNGALLSYRPVEKEAA